MKTLRQRYPFSAIVGQEELKQALLLNLIYPGIGGVLIRGEKGTAKSTAVRALEAILPEIDVVDGCPCGCDPHGDALCPWCLEQEALESVSRQVRVVDLPVGSTEDRVVGSLDMETALREGRRRFEPGILADTNRGILYVDEINLLDDHLVDVLLDAAAMGVNMVASFPFCTCWNDEPGRRGTPPAASRQVRSVRGGQGHGGTGSAASGDDAPCGL